MKIKIESAKRVIVCDFPSEFLFPPIDYGGIERWLWSVAKRSAELGYTVILSGPLWRKELLPQAIYLKERITEVDAEDFLRKYGKADYLVAGFEYFKDKYLKEKMKKMARILITHQAMSTPYKRKEYNGKDVILFCFSDEMMKKYEKQSPVKIDISGEGFNEEPIKRDPEDYIVWIGRIDKDKSPHYAVMAAKKLNMKIYLIGKPRYQLKYAEKYKNILSQPNVKHIDAISGKEKIELLAKAKCGIYTCSSEWTEAVGIVLSEILSCGVPIAGITWKGNDSVVEAIGKKGGVVKKVEAGMTDDEISSRLVEAIKQCLTLNRNRVYAYGSRRFDRKELVKTMFDAAEKRAKAVTSE